MSVVCTKRGYKDATKTISSHFNFVTFGNFVLGGTTGIIIDASDGANESYPGEIEVPMERAPSPPPIRLFAPGMPTS
jgi:hypothetical protein